LPGLEAKILLADKAYDADERVIEPLRAAGKQAVIPSKKNRKEPRPYDRELYKARSLVEIFFCNLKQFRAIATTGSSEAVTRPRLPQNVACGVTALRSSAVDSQHRERLQLPVRSRRFGRSRFAAICSSFVAMASRSSL
jgi:transposase